MKASSPPKNPAPAESLTPNGKPLHYLIQNLEQAYGTPVNPPKSDALDMLVRIILSQATSDINSERAYTALKSRFTTYEQLFARTPRDG